MARPSLTSFGILRPRRHSGPPRRAAARRAIAGAAWLALPAGAGVAAVAAALLSGAATAAAFGALSAALVLAGGLLVRSRRQRRALREQAERLSDQVWELREDAEQARLALESQGGLVIRRDAAGRIAFANDAYCRLVGRTREAVIHSEFAPEVLEQGAAEMLDDGTRRYEQRIAGATGPRWIAWREAPIRIGGRLGIQAVGQDITRQVEAERALAAAREAAEAAGRARSRLLAMASHEIRTPLSGILGMAGLLGETPLTPEQASYVAAIRQSGALLQALTEDVLDLARADAGRLALEVRPFRLRPLIEETVELLAPRAQAKGLALAADIDDALDTEVSGDAARLRQVLLNLLGNAIKFTETGGATLIAEAGDAPDEVVFEVRDTGIGIAPEAKERVFLEFEQEHSGADRSHGGAGLGLAISQRLVALMGGRIGLDSHPGEGATFRVVLPLPPTGADASAGQPTPDLTGQEILIVSPFATEAGLLARRLGRWGAKTCQAADALVAAALLPERPWAALLVDQSIPVQDRAMLTARAGRAAQRLLLVTPAGRHGTAGTAEDTMAAAMEGFTGYLVKPVRLASLAERLASPAEPGPPVAAADAPSELEAGLAATLAENLAATLPVAANGAPEGLAVLIAEDNDINALLARALLARLGHRATLATDGAAAVDAWRAARAAGQPFDLVLMDLQMPGLDGFEAARRIRAAEAAALTGDGPEPVPVPIIALTATDMADERAACHAAGMSAVLVKPLDRDKLLEVLQTLPGFSQPGAHLAA